MATFPVRSGVGNLIECRARAVHHENGDRSAICRTVPGRAAVGDLYSGHHLRKLQSLDNGRCTVIFISSYENCGIQQLGNLGIGTEGFRDQSAMSRSTVACSLGIGIRFHPTGAGHGK